MESKLPIEVVEPPTIVFSGNWTMIKRTVFRKPECTENVVWESCHRPYTLELSDVHGVNVIPILHRKGKKFFVLIKQFRIPSNGYCIEFPAGALNVGETVEEAAFRELKEETGFTGKRVISRSDKKILLDPGMSDNSMGLYVVEVDGDSEENKDPKQNLDAAEYLDTILVECENLLSYIRSQTNDVSIANIVYAFALGYAMQNAMNSTCTIF